VIPYEYVPFIRWNTAVGPVEFANQLVPANPDAAVAGVSDVSVTSTVHIVPFGIPLCSIVISDTNANVTEAVAGAPVTVTEPLPPRIGYHGPDAAISYEYVPFTSGTTMVGVDELIVAVPTVADHISPLGSPLSVNVTGYWVGPVGVNVIAWFTFAPSTVTVPDEGDTV
jgi:hypothetical protein